jgi:hypothetical protein
VAGSCKHGNETSGYINVPLLASQKGLGSMELVSQI